MASPAARRFGRGLAGALGMPSLLATPPRPLEEIAIAPSRLEAAHRAHFAALLGEDRVRDSAYERAFPCARPLLSRPFAAARR